MDSSRWKRKWKRTRLSFDVHRICLACQQREIVLPKELRGASVCSACPCHAEQYFYVLRSFSQLSFIEAVPDDIHGARDWIISRRYS